MLAFYLSLLEDEDDKLTFEEAYEQYKAAALRAAYRVTGNQETAEDAVHDGFMKILEDWGKFLQIPCDKRKSRFVIIVKNKAIDILRREKVLNIQELDENIPAGGADLSAIMEQKDNVEFLIGCVSKLPEAYKSVLELKMFHELSNQEIEETLALKQSTVAMRLLRARAQLSEMIEEVEHNHATV